MRGVQTRLPFTGVKRSVSDAPFDLAAGLERGRHVLCTSLRDRMDVLRVEHIANKTVYSHSISSILGERVQSSTIPYEMT